MVEGLRAQTRVDSSQMDSVPAVAANDGCGGNMETSSLCPVVALGSYWSTAWYKMILHVVMLTGRWSCQGVEATLNVEVETSSTIVQLS